MSNSIFSFLVQVFNYAIEKAFPQLQKAEIARILDISHSQHPQFGHYQCNAAMKLAKILGQPPRNIASAIIQQLDQREFEKIEIAGPGFINITLNKEYLEEKLTNHLRDVRLGIPEANPKKRIIIDFSSPNIAKEMHVGHMRSTIIGESLARLFEFLGHDVLRLNHVGDWGTSFGMLIAYLKIHHPDVMTGEKSANITELVGWYRASKRLFDSDLTFKTMAQKEVIALQSGEETARIAWKKICAISRSAYQEIYDILDVSLTERGESYYNSMLPEIVLDLENKGLIKVSEGAKCIFLEDFKNREGNPLPLMLQKSDGGYNYDTTDMAALRHRINIEKGERIIYVVDAGQSIHFQMIFKASQMAGYLDPNTVTAEHVPFGLVLGEDGKKFRTRSGETEKLIDLLQEAIGRATALVIERNPSLPLEEQEHTGRLLGLAAVKYADLACNRTSDYLFSYERMLRFDGNTAVFLMYSYVRALGIQRRINADIDILINSEISVTLNHPSEIALSLQLLQFAETLENIERDLLPNRLCDYLFSLAEHFNAFFRDCRVEGASEQNSRLLLTEAFIRTMRLGLYLLGIKTVEKM